jgi:hypothetical protein
MRPLVSVSRRDEVGYDAGMKIALALVLLAAACQKPTSTEEPTTAAPPSTTAEPEPEPQTTTPDQPPAGGECKPSGCSGIVCSDQDIVTTCEFKPEYACYRDATCTRQEDGQCGWTPTPELDACLKNPPPAE